MSELNTAAETTAARASGTLSLSLRLPLRLSLWLAALCGIICPAAAEICLRPLGHQCLGNDKCCHYYQ